MASWKSRSRISVLGAVAIATIAHAAAAQVTAGVLGLVTDKSTGAPVIGALVTALEGGRMTQTDSSGRFRLAGLRAGPTELTIHAPGFPRTQLPVNLVAGATIERKIALDSTASRRVEEAQSLPAVAVTAPAKPNYRLADFERRRLNGRGQYMTEDEIIKSGAYTVPDAVKNMRGVLYECGGGECFVHMARAPMRCLPEFIVDGQVMNDFGPTTPIRDIIGLEVYTGPSEVPGEYAGRYAGCGVIVLWTRSGPTRKSQ